MAAGVFIHVNRTHSKEHDGIRPQTKAVGVALLTFAIASSFEVLLSPVAKPITGWALVSSSLLFTVDVCLKLLIIFWIVALSIGILKPERISEFGAKVFGVEINNKYTKEDVGIAQAGYEQLSDQMAMVADINGMVLEYISGQFEANIISAPDQAEAIRRAVRDILTVAYGRYEDIVIHVIPLVEEKIDALEPRLGAMVRLAGEEGDISTVDEKNRAVGIAIHHGEGGLNTAIVIDATKKERYEVSLAEICAASTLFVSISTAVDWAQRCGVSKASP